MSRAKRRYQRNNSALPALTPNVFRVTLGLALDLQVMQCQFFYKDDGTLGAPTDLPNIESSWETHIMPPLAAAMSSDVGLTYVKVENLFQVLFNPYFHTLIGQFGTAPSGHFPSFTAVCIRRGTNFRTACGRGRVYLPGVPKTWVTTTPNYIDSGAPATAYNNAAAAILTTFTVGAVVMQPALYSKGSYKHQTIGWAPLVSAGFDTLLATSRRRVIGRGK
jgi:hypothetical protein